MRQTGKIDLIGASPLLSALFADEPTIEAASALGRVTGPAFAGALFEHVGASAPFACSSVLLFLAFGLALVGKFQRPLSS